MLQTPPLSRDRELSSELAFLVREALISPFYHNPKELCLTMTVSNPIGVKTRLEKANMLSEKNLQTPDPVVESAEGKTSSDDNLGIPGFKLQGCTVVLYGTIEVILLEP